MKETIIIWLKAARAPFLIVSFLPCVVAGLLAANDGVFNTLYFALVTVGIVLAHSAADFVDDYFDYINGNLGNKDQQFHDSPLIHGQITTRQVIIATVLCSIGAIACGLYLLIEIGLPVLYLSAVGAFIVLFYTSPPIKLNYRGFGETALFLAFGPLIIMGVYYVLTESISFEAAAIGIPLGLFTMNIGLVSNIFDYEDDVENNKKCIPVLFGQKRATMLLTVTVIVAFICIAGSAFLEVTSRWTLLSMLSFPLALRCIKLTWNFKDLTKYEPAMQMAIGTSSVSAILFAIAYSIEIFV
jgi:1,4-dihydroxy-2-naphthoate octaprenyltransferase|tara:strand:+ start:4391 stop:5287 length:897 start_codon:yes stop_codon:yes gene_type:complete